MGYYIQAPTPKDKAAFIVSMYGWKVVSRDEAEAVVLNQNSDQAVIVVLDNGIFEAAGLAFSPNEFKEFAAPTDDRIRTYVLMEKKLAHELSGYNG